MSLFTQITGIDRLVGKEEHLIQSGLQDDLDDITLLLYAGSTRNDALANAIIAVTESFFTEGVEAGTTLVKPTLAKLLAAGKDPFAGSRHALEAAEKQFPTALAAARKLALNPVTIAEALFGLLVMALEGKLTIKLTPEMMTELKTAAVSTLTAAL